MIPFQAGERQLLTKRRTRHKKSEQNTHNFFFQVHISINLIKNSNIKKIKFKVILFNFFQLKLTNITKIVIYFLKFKYNYFFKT